MTKILIYILILVLAPSLNFAQSGDLNNRFLLAQNFEQAGELEKAKTLYEEIYKSQPDNQVFFQCLNRVYVTLKSYQKSISLIESEMTFYPADISLFGLLGSSYYLSGNEKAAFNSWDNGIKLQPANETVYRLMANYALERRSFEKAIDILKKGKSISKDPKTFSFDLANLYTLTMDYTSATEEYSSILLQFPDQYPYIEGKILSYITKPEALDITIKILENRKTESNTSFYYLLSHLYLEKKNYTKAFDYYLFVDKKLNRQGAELFSFGQKVLNDGNDEVAAKTFDYILNNYPSSSFYSSAKLGYAKSLEAKFEKETADSTIDWLPYIVPSVNNKETDYKKLLDIYAELIKLYPHTEIAIESYFHIGSIYYNKLYSIAKAKEYFNIIVKDYPLSQYYNPTCSIMSDISLIEGDIVSAQNYLTKILTNNRSNQSQRYSAMLDNARIYFYKNDFTSAKKSLADIMSNLEDNTANDAIELSLLINTTIEDSTLLSDFAAAELLARRNIFSEAAEKFRLISLKKENFILSSLASVTRAEILIALNKYPEAIDILNKVSEEREKNIYSDKALYLKAKTYQYLVKDIPKAIDNYQEILINFPNSLYLEESREELTKLRNKSS